MFFKQYPKNRMEKVKVILGTWGITVKSNAKVSVMEITKYLSAYKWMILIITKPTSKHSASTFNKHNDKVKKLASPK